MKQRGLLGNTYVRRFLRSSWALYSVPRLTTTLVYMLQNTEYHPAPYLRWFWRTQDFSQVMHRRQLDATPAARLLRYGLFVGVGLHIIAAALWIYASVVTSSPGGVWYGAAALVAYPVVWAHVLALAVWLGDVCVRRPREQRHAATAAQLFRQHPGKRIAIAGSYGKTSMKELLRTVLSEGLVVAATPGNMNVVSSHARFASSLTGAEDVVLVEFGEGKPGDIAQFAAVFQPTHAVITGLAPAHLDHYKTVAAAGADIFSLASVVPPSQIYVNADAPAAHDFLQPDFRIYSQSTVLGWRVQKAVTSIAGTSFELVKGKRRLRLHSRLVGLHQVGPLAFAAAVGLQFGLSEKQVAAGLAKTEPFEHRMQPYRLGKAWVIDDTYNGNLEGIKAGTALLAELKATRKLYVTPGLVDQGKDTADIHRQVGRLIASARPDVVVLMRNSAAPHIQAGLEDTDYIGELLVQDNPLEFYTNLSSFLAAGDVVLMQNDWTDNYA